jgi:hypothetical protein
MSAPPVVIVHHIGLGDHIMLNGMARHLSQIRRIIILVNIGHKESIDFMYRDCPAITVDAHDNLETNMRNVLFNYVNTGCEILPLATYGLQDQIWKAFAHGDTPFVTWAHLPYFQAKVNPEYMKTKFHVERDPEREQACMVRHDLTGKDYIFVHSEPARHKPNIVESQYQVFNPDPTETPFNVFDYLGVLENAKEIHCINSSWAWVVELCKLGSKQTNFLNCTLAYSSCFQPPSTVKMVFTDLRWTFKE